MYDLFVASGWVKTKYNAGDKTSHSPTKVNLLVGEVDVEEEKGESEVIVAGESNESPGRNEGIDSSTSMNIINGENQIENKRVHEDDVWFYGKSGLYIL